MSDQFLHGVEVVEDGSGQRPIKTVKSSVIGIVGTAPDADTNAFPLNTPVLITNSRLQAAKLKANAVASAVNTSVKGTLPSAMDAIFDQAGAMVVVVRVDEGVSEAETLSNVIGGVDATTDQYTGLQALLTAKSILGVSPRILIAPGFTQHEAVLQAFVGVADRLKGFIYADADNTTQKEAVAYAKNKIGSRRVRLTYPAVKRWDTGSNQEIIVPASAVEAGIRAKLDNEQGFWFSISNQLITGIVGTSAPIDFTLGDANCAANYLNDNKVATIIQQDGYRTWGNRTCSGDSKWLFESVVRTADMINDSLLRAHLWAVDRNISKTYIEEVSGGVNAYLRSLKAQGAILGGSCWADPELNSAANIAQGKIYFDFEFTPSYPAEHITFTSHLVNDYVEELV